MRIDRTGCTRIVILTKRYAFKFPQIIACDGKYSWEFFLKGLLANMQEVKFWKYSKWEELCPIPFYLPGGFLVVMPKVRVLTGKEFDEFKFERFVERDGYRIPVEAKPDSYGWLNGSVVAIDYGN